VVSYPLSLVGHCKSMNDWSVTEKVIKGTICDDIVYVARVMTHEGYWKLKEFSSYSDAKFWCVAYRM